MDTMGCNVLALTLQCISALSGHVHKAVLTSLVIERYEYEHLEHSCLKCTEDTCNWSQRPSFDVLRV